MSESFRIGPGRILVATSMSSPISDWTDLGTTTGGVTVSLPSPQIARGRVDQATAPLTVDMAPGVGRVSCKLTDTEAVKIAAALPGSVRLTSSAKVALKVPSAPAAQSTFAVMVVPELDNDGTGNGFDSEFVVYAGAAVLQIGEREAGTPVEDGEQELHGYRLDIIPLADSSFGVGYPFLNAELTTPLGCLFLYQPTIDGLTPAVGSAATFTRASTATYVDSNGIIQTATTNTPRYQDGGLLLEPQRTNLFLNSDTLVTQDVTVSATAYTVSFYGTGTVTFSGTYSGSLAGTGVSDRVSVTFTPTAGTLTCTVSGSVTSAQIEAGSYPTSYIPTAGSTVTRNADVFSIPRPSGLSVQSDFTAIINAVPLFGDEEGLASASFRLFGESDPQIEGLYPEGVPDAYRSHLKGFSVDSSETIQGGTVTKGEDMEALFVSDADGLLTYTIVEGGTAATPATKSWSAVKNATDEFGGTKIIAYNNGAWILKSFIVTSGLLTYDQIRSYLRA